jgi:hypothetical protein
VVPLILAEDYPAIRDIMDKGKGLPFSHDDWRKRCEDNERYWKRRGFVIVPFKVNPDEYVAFCAAWGLAKSPDTLVRFVAAQVFPKG